MGWSDLLVIVVILIFALIGFKTGFVLTLYRLVSMLLSFWIALQLYPIVSKFLIGTPVFDWVKGAILGPVNEKLSGFKTLTLQKGIEQLGLPSFMGDWVQGSQQGGNSAKVVADIGNMIATALAELSMKILAVLLVFILAFFLLLIIKNLLKVLVKLPIIKQIDKIAGVIFGALTGMLVAYLLCAGIIIFGNSLSSGIQKDVDKSLIAKYFVKDNYIVTVLSKTK
ncbi:MAG: CvpA family protein [Clostridia bacterium]